MFTKWLVTILIILGVIILVGLILFLLFGLRKNRDNKPKIVIDNEFIDELILNLGTKDNILSFEVLNGRVKFSVKDLDNLKIDELKNMSPTGVFISGNNVKLLFKYDSEVVNLMLKERGV